MPKSATGLWKRGEVWHIDKRIRGYGRLCENTGAITLEDAECYYVRRLDQIRQSLVSGVRPKHLFRAAATKYLLEHQHKRSIVTNAFHLEQLDKWIGNTTLDQIHDGTLKPFVIHRQEKAERAKPSIWLWKSCGGS